MTFTRDSFNESYQYGFSLLPGYGCYIAMDRHSDGSYGTVTFDFQDSNLLIFDNFQQTIISGEELPMPETASGWSQRSFFLVNRGAAATEFLATFNGAWVAAGIIWLSALSLLA
mmetsp:Transcript_13789/g.13471  ORF Transcript_13789/g.13471 Transcript_13789/m.13471 type:complete len:114 (-) Transcript_13789:44-385(-)